MRKFFKSKVAQTVSEYSMTLVIIFTVLLATSALVKRTLSAKIKDSKDYMIRQVRAAANSHRKNSSEDKLVVFDAYEPYYVLTNSEVDRSSDETIAMRGAAEPGDFWRRNINQNMEMKSESMQLPPGAGEGILYEDGSGGGKKNEDKVK